MNTNRIETLLEKFYEGQTELREEEELRGFFSQEDVPDHLREHMPLFRFYDQTMYEAMDDSAFARKFEQRLSKEEETPVVPIYAGRNRWLYAAGVAAGLVLLVGLVFTLWNFHPAGNVNPAQTASLEISYANATEALMLVSGNLNHGLRHAERLGMVDKAFQELALLNKFYQYQTIIINPDDFSTPSINQK